MKRLHVHLSVADLDESVKFYSTLFGAGPDRKEDDYAKWMLDDPGVNFALSARGGEPGLNHLGLQVDSDEDLGLVTGPPRHRVGEFSYSRFDQRVRRRRRSRHRLLRHRRVREIRRLRLLFVRQYIGK
jgi:catechol 2,3-dioxygenase-like lactoylglutathione lyase family enzyme